MTSKMTEIAILSFMKYLLRVIVASETSDPKSLRKQRLHICLRVEDLQILGFFAHAHELDRQT